MSDDLNAIELIGVTAGYGDRAAISSVSLSLAPGSLTAIFGPNGGGYETRLTSYSNLEITAGTQFMNVGLELAAKMKPAKLPERPNGPAGKPWAYGDQPPQLK